MSKKHKELKEQFKQYRPDMGVFVIRNLRDGKRFIEATADLKGTMNGARFRLECGRHPCEELQAAWREAGPGAFSFEVVDHLAYKQTEEPQDYGEDLKTLKGIWVEKLSREAGAEFYR
ncbi:MAG: GIY-YIG nuclease family protein [candidate division FCPU426 bacterium]